MHEMQKREAEGLGLGAITEVLSEIPIMYSGWECDQKAWLVRFEHSKKPVCLTTSNGTLVRWSQQDMQDKLAETSTSARAIRTALSMILGVSESAVQNSVANKKEAPRSKTRARLRATVVAKIERRISKLLESIDSCSREQLPIPVRFVSELVALQDTLSRDAAKDLQ